MAFAFNGIGTTFYGKDDYRPDGSFVTTEWAVIFYVPLIPLRSHRVIRNPKGDLNVAVYHRTGYQILEKLPLQWKQITAIWVGLLLTVAWLVGMFAVFFAFVNDPLHKAMIKSNQVVLDVIIKTVIIGFILVFPLSIYKVRQKKKRKIFDKG
jgi:hypothetical protein